MELDIYELFVYKLRSCPEMKQLVITNSRGSNKGFNQSSDNKY